MRVILVIVVSISLWTCSKGNDVNRWADLLRILKSECRKETGIDKSSIHKLYEPEVDKSDITLLKYIQCMVTIGGFVDEEGNANLDVLKTHFLNLGIAEDVITKAAQNCIKQSEDPLLKIAYYYDCYRKYLPQRVLAV